MSAWPATGETIPLVRAASERHRVVEGERSVEDAAGDLAAVGHLAERRRVDGRADVGRNGLDRREDRDPRRDDAERDDEVDGVLDDVALVDQRRIDGDGRVGDEERPRIGRRVDREHVADAPRGAQAGLGRDDRVHQFVRVQRALHQRFDLAGPRHRDRLVGGGVAVLGRDDRIAGDVDAGRFGRTPDLGFRTDQHRLDQVLACRLDGAGQRGFVDRMHDRGLERLEIAGCARSEFCSAGPSPASARRIPRAVRR